MTHLVTSMAKFNSSLAEGEIREGYLCPICLSDLRNVSQLQEHFELVHPSEDHDVIQTLKGFFDKAKRKILKRENTETELVKTSLDPEPAIQIQTDSPTQDIGKFSCHKTDFLDFRKHKIDYYDKESNKLLIRLAKLLNDVSCDVEKRKELENSVIPWVKNSDVPLCPSCGKSFGLSRRWHHCRLCGFVMCKSCSCFISYEFVQKLVDCYMSESQSPTPKISPRKASNISFSGLIHPPTDPELRVCIECEALLKRRDRRKEQKNHFPFITQNYDRLREHMTEIQKLIPQYMEIIESLNSGETEYQLEDIQELKRKITRLAERVDTYSKRIAQLEPADEGSLQLHTAVRVSASQFLRQSVLTLPPPPTQKELDLYQSQRLNRVYQRIQKEKEQELQQFQQDNTSPPLSPDTGWCVNMDGVPEEEDLMIQQMNLILRYIQQARQDHRHDEVKMLEANLHELRLEHARQRKASVK